MVPTQDRRQKTPTARIEGNVVVQGPARGNVVLFLFDADRPPPPEGTGRPVSFTVLPAASVFGSQLDSNLSGPFSAPFTFSLVAEGRYLLKGFVDSNADFIPWYGVTSEPNAGDVGGASVDLATGRLLPVVVEADSDGLPLPATDVSVVFSSTATVPVDRPVFSVTGTSSFNPAAGAKFLELFPAPVASGRIQQKAPVFLAQYVDADKNGIPDDANSDGVPEFYPKVYVRKLIDDTHPLLDENDADKNGIPDEDGVDYEHLGQAKDGKPDVVVLRAGFDPTPIITALTNGSSQPIMTPVPLPKLTLVLQPGAVDVSKPSAPSPLKGVPKGVYAIILVGPTGQTWRVPNELQPGVAKGLGFPERASQGFFVEVK